MHKEGWIHQLKWISPHTSPPNGLPTVLGTWNREPTKDDFLAVYPKYKLGCGYCHAIILPITPKKTLPEKTRQQMLERRKKTQKAKWLRKNMPLFAEQIIEEEGLDWRKSA